MNLVATVGMAHFVFRLNLSRGYVGLLIPTIVGFSALWRMVLRHSRSRVLRQGRGHHRVVAVGPAEEVRHLVIRLRAQPKASIEVVGFVADDLASSAEVTPPLDQLLRLPDRDAIQHLAASGVGVDLLVRAGRPDPEEMAVLGRQAHLLGVPVAIAPHQRDTSANMAVSYVPLGSTPLLVMETPTLKPAAAALKTILDKSIALVALVVLAPALLAVAAVIALRDGRPILFRQERVGHHGRTFGCLKFRTMCTDAEAQLELLRHRNEADGPLFKLRDDPRVTATGRWLRAHSVDEIPQLWNVLKGDMSIVGPRPPLPAEVATYDERAARRLLVRPGITGLWQVEGRSDLPWDDGVYLDLMYVDHWSPLLDFVIMARTAKTLLRPSGAY
jgi:exopolysaccharide biosynthesis polyprenyl glycosylphosphotransferase